MVILLLEYNYFVQKEVINIDNIYNRWYSKHR